MNTLTFQKLLFYNIFLLSCYIRADIPSDPEQILTKGLWTVFSTTGCPDEQWETLPKSENHKWVKTGFYQDGSRWPKN